MIFNKRHVKQSIYLNKWWWLLSALLFVPLLSANEYDVCYEEWRPFAFKKSSGAFVGTIIEPLIESAKINGVVINLHELPHSRCLELVRNNTIDYALFVDDSDQLKKLNIPLASWNISLVTRQGERYNTLLDLKNSEANSVVIGRNYHYPEKVMQVLNGLNKKILTSSYYVDDEVKIRNLFRVLTEERADVMVMDRSWALTLKVLYKLPIEVAVWTLHSETQYMGYQEQSLESVTQMTKVIQGINKITAK